MAVEDLHEGIRLAGMIYVMRTIPAPASIQAPAIIDRTDAQLSPRRPAIGLGLRYSLAGVLRNFSSSLEVSNCKASFTFNGRLPDR